MNFTQILNSISGLTEEQLRMLNASVVTEIKTARSRKSANIKDTLSVGDTVSFRGRKRGRRGLRFDVEGIITKIKRKNADVNVDGARWTVPISLIQKLKTPDNTISIVKD